MVEGSARERLRRRIAASGPIPFADFMEEALYGEGGYYRRRELPIGEEGDYVTGSSLSPLFGRSTARLLRRLDAVLGLPAELVEAGFGGGAHLEAVVAALGEEGAGRRLRAWDRVARPAPAGVEAVADLAAVRAGEVEGLLFSYELLDALPVHRLVGREDGTVGELWVALAEEGRAGGRLDREAEAPARAPVRDGPADQPLAGDPLQAEALAGDPQAQEIAAADAPGGRGGFAWRASELSRPELSGLLGGALLEPGQVADLSPQWAPLYRRLARRLGRGLLVTCDYGFERPRLLDPRVRRHGTLACYTRQRVHRNPFVRVGEQDLTAHVDFTALAEAGEAEGLTTVCLTRQALWLTACGLFEDLAGADAATRREAMALLDGEGMGEEIRVLVQARGIDPARVLDRAILAG